MLRVRSLAICDFEVAAIRVAKVRVQGKACTFERDIFLTAAPDPFIPNGSLVLCSGWEPVGHLQGSLGPSWPETPKKSEKSLPGSPAPGPPESLEKVPEKVRRVWK